MSRRKIKAGSTSQILPLFIQDTSSSTGAGLGSLVYNTASLAAKYRRQGDSSWTAITLVTATAGTFTSGGFVADGGSVTGGYEIGLPNAMLAAGATWAQLQIYGATNMLAVLVEFELDAVDYQDTVRFGLTAMPNVASGSAGALLVDGTGTAAISNSSGKVLLQATQTGVTIPTVTTVTNQLTAAAIATGVWQSSTGSNFTVASSIGKSLYTSGNAPGAASGLALVGSNMGTITGGTITTYTGNTPQTGDAFARIGATGSGLTSLAPASTALSTATWTTARAGYIDNLSAGAVMLASSYSAPPSAATISTQVGTDLSTAHGAGSWATATGFSTLDAAGVRTAVGLASANLDTQLDALPTAAENAAALLDLTDGVETSLTLRQALRLMVAAESGKISGGGTTTITIRNTADTKDRITATVDSLGNRTAVTRDLT